MSWIVHPTTSPQPAHLGGKARGLVRLASSFRVPPFFVVGPDAFLFSYARCGGDATGAPRDVDPAIVDAIAQALEAHLPRCRTVAVRSSAAEEDGVAHSFAGQLCSFLEVPRDEVAARVLDVWRSATGPGVRQYRAARGLEGEPAPPAVIVQAMVAAECAGVAFGADPAAGRDGTWVSATRGLADRLVSGDVDGELHVVDLGAGTSDCRDAREAEPVLGPREATDVARTTAAVGEALGAPQDVEWAIADGEVHLLQARPITATRLPALPARKEILWDDSNIAESYPGISSALTFSFIRRAYAEVYRSFARVMGVSGRRLEDHASTFRNMLGYHRGRVFYNLLNWYRVVAMLPGYAANQHFMEEMLGVDKGLTADVRARVLPQRRRSRILGRWHLVRMAARLGWNFVALPWAVRRWQRRLDLALDASSIRDAQGRVDALDAPALVARYRALEGRLLTRWQTPIVNDFFGMVFHGLLRRVAARWCGDVDGTLANGVLCASGDVVSAEPAARARDLADLVRDDPRAIQRLEAGRLPADAAFVRGYEAWLDRFGDRCTGELKLESTTLTDDPTPLLQTIAGLARAERRTGGAAADRALAGARGEARRRLRWRPLRRLSFAFVHAQARNRLRGRENLRFERTRLFGEVRRILRALGGRLAEAGALDDARDVFFLEVEEVLGFVEGTSSTRDLRGLVAHRRAERARWEEASAPPARFWTHALADVDGATTDLAASAEVEDGPERAGLGLSPGVARGRVRVVSDPRAERVAPGEILVAERTDPGWILAFASSAALVVEHGSLLSHVAIVARELGVPAVTGIAGVAGWLRTGDVVEVDGDRGTVTRIETADALPAAAEARRA